VCSADGGHDDRTARAVIRDEALRLFAEHGQQAVSLRQVASAAGVSPGLIVHHFGSKANPEILAAFLMVNDLAVFLLRDQLSRVLDVDPLARDGMTRWADVVLAVYRDGLFTGTEGT